MQRLLLKFVIAAEAVARAEALLELAGAETVGLSDAADDPVLEPAPNTAPLWPQVVVRAQFPADSELTALAELLCESCNASDVTIDELRDSDWEAGLRQVFRARPIGRRLWLAPADAAAAVPPDRIIVRLNMGFAFGTGEHPTTALCLDWLDLHLSAGGTFGDYGCGSGVLAIAALALGAREAWAIDNDPQALAATHANAALNGVGERLLIGSPADLPSTAVDVLAANILAGPLIEHAPLYATRVHPGGSLVLSGILEAQAADVRAAYEPSFTRFEHVTRDGWVRIACVRRGQ